MTDNFVAKRLKVNGIVQGVGFRPFVFQLAQKYGLKGEVANTSAGVSILVEGLSANVTSFEADLATQAPPLAYIVDIASQSGTVNHYADFAIVKSQGEAELLDPGNRRYHYPFINCTNCGPRYTIIDDIPYDRPKTSMRYFIMCAACQAEYDEPTNRRFHAQPNACDDCGPCVGLFDNLKNEMDKQDPVGKAVELLKQGHILAIKGLGGYHLAADAANTDAVRRLRRRKMREEKPFAVMSADLAAIRGYAAVNTEEEQLLTSIRRPIVLLKKKARNLISDQVAPRNNYFGVMLPYTPLHYLAIRFYGPGDDQRQLERGADCD